MLLSLKILIRHLRNHPLTTVINIASLSLGLTAGIIVLIFVLDELSYDRFHRNKDRIFRVGTDVVDHKTGKINSLLETNGWPVGDRLKKEYPEIESLVYARKFSSLQLRHNNKIFNEDLHFVSNDFFHIFSFNLLKGNPENALLHPYSLVITEEMEKKYFGSQDALGKSLVLSDTLIFKVTGVVEDIPRQSHIQFDMLGSFSTYPMINRHFNTDGGWGNINVRNYVLLKENTDIAEFTKKARNVYMDNAGEATIKLGMEMYASFEPVADVYLKTNRGNGFGPVGSMDRVHLIATISLFVILIACINFINLSTACSFNRAKEVGLKKVIGSSRHILIRQFLIESFLMTLTSFFIAIVLVDLCLPFFNEILEKQYTLYDLLNPLLFAGILILLPVVSLSAGYYPALVLSGFKPAEILKGKMSGSARGLQLRRVLIVFQFVLSITLIISTLMVSRQIEYMKERNLGFKKDHVVVVDTRRVPQHEVMKAVQPLRNDLESLSGVLQVSFTWALPGKSGWRGQWAYPEGLPDGESVVVEYIPVDHHYLETLDIQLVAGRNFDQNRKSDLEEGLILNETAVRVMKWESPDDAIGKTITSPSGHPEGTVIGVVKDFHQRGLQQEIGPIVLDHLLNFNRFFALKVSNKASEEVIQSLNTLWDRYFEAYPFSHFYLDEDFQRQYQQEELYGKMFTTFSVVSIFIAVIGLFGLVSFVVNSRSKEIGVRKVLGANEVLITFLLSKEFIVLLISAMVITMPLAWYLSEKWLQNYAYRTSIDPAIFIIGFLITFLVTFLTISYQTIKAAKTNPVDTLRSE